MILVAGESLIDIITRGGDLRAVPGGGPFNVARTTARLGQRCAYLGPLSTDGFGTELRGFLQADGVDDRWSPAIDAPTTLAVARIDDSGAATYSFYVEGTSAAGLSPEQALAALSARPEVVCVGALGLVLEPTAISLEALVAALGADVLLAVDPNCRPAVVADEAHYRSRLDRLLARADLVKVSTEDLSFLAPREDPVAVAMRLRSLCDGVLLLTDGGHDVHALGENFQLTVPVPRVPVVDTVGAGDSFLGAVLAHWVARGHGREQLRDATAVGQAVEFGVGVSGLTCGRLGADPPRADELPPELFRLIVDP